MERSEKTNIVDTRPLEDQLTHQWHCATLNNSAAQSQWEIESGHWSWRKDAAVAMNNGSEWSCLDWRKVDGAVCRALGNFMIEVTVSGRAEAAGLSFGHYKDFLAALNS